MHALFTVLVVAVCLSPVVLGGESSPRTRLEKLQLPMARSVQTHLIGPRDRHLYFAEGENAGRSHESLANHVGDAALNIPPVPRANRQPCGGQGRDSCTKPEVTPEPVLTPPPIAPPRPLSPAIPAKSKDLEFSTPPPIPELPLGTPNKLDCGDLYNPRDNDSMLVRVPGAPLGDLDVANIGKELPVLKKVIAQLDNRAAWLSAQKHWLVKTTEATAAVHREIELAEHTKATVASDLEQLQIAQDALSVRLKANKLKWAFKDKKMTLEQLHEQLVELQRAKIDVTHAMRDARDDVTVLETTLGPPSQHVQISPAELEDPLKFLGDIQPNDDDFYV